MPQRQFWTHRHPVRVTFTFAVDPTGDDDTGQATMKVEDQSGACMAWGGGSTPPGFGSWAFADACRMAMEAYELASPEDAKRAFLRALSQWRRDAKALLSIPQ